MSAAPAAPAAGEPPRVRLFYPHGVQWWLPTPGQLHTLGTLVSAPATVEIRPRAQLAETWARVHGQPLPVPPCAIRAWARKPERRAWIFVDPSETKESVLWLLGHELAHLELRQVPLVELGVTAPQGPDYLATDEGHERDPEEQLCNAVGTALVALLTGRRQDLNRHWWRRRVRRLGVCP